jgi:general secretion pathway protein G
LSSGRLRSKLSFPSLERKLMRSTMNFFRTFSQRGPLANQRGLTLIEIMVVLMIIGGLAAVLGKTVFDNLANAKVKQTRLQFSEVSKALEMYNGDCGGLPTTEQGLQALLADPGKDVCPNWGPKPYSKKTVMTDPWGRPLIYESDGTNFVLKSLGADRREGGEGDKKDLSSTDGEEPQK